jgi:uncharacterized damage-inducible protein DinB
MNPESLYLLFGYTYWASDRVWDCIMRLTDDQFTQDIPYSMGSIRNHVVHMMSSTRRWLKRLEGADVPPHLAYEDYPTREAARAKWDELRAEALAYLHSLTPEQLNQTIQWQLPHRGEAGSSYRWEILLHVANHATDHRSQMLAMMNTRFGLQTPEQDIIVYLGEKQG